MIDFDIFVMLAERAWTECNKRYEYNPGAPEWGEGLVGNFLSSESHTLPESLRRQVSAPERLLSVSMDKDSSPNLLQVQG
jgi:hypothetical protein